MRSLLWLGEFFRGFRAGWKEAPAEDFPPRGRVLFAGGLVFVVVGLLLFLE